MISESSDPLRLHDCKISHNANPLDVNRLICSSYEMMSSVEYNKSFVNWYDFPDDGEIPVPRRKPRLSPATHQKALCFCFIRRYMFGQN